MILGHLESKNLKGEIPTSIWEALQFVLENDFSQMENGTYPINGDALFLNIMTVDTVSVDSKPYEIHKNYADIQILIDGEELMEFASSEDKVEPITFYDKTTDFQAVNPVEKSSTVVLQPNMFAVFFPQEPHKPTCFINESSTVRKAVLKVHKDLLK